MLRALAFAFLVAGSSVHAQDIEPEVDTNSEEEEAFGDDFDEDYFEDDMDDMDDEESLEEETVEDVEEEVAEDGEVADDGEDGDEEVAEPGAEPESSEEVDNTSDVSEEEKPAANKPKQVIKNRLSGVQVGAAQAVYETLEKTVKHFEAEAGSVREEIRQLAERRYKERKKKIEGKYDGSINPLLVQERQARMDAITAFERFLQRHPDSKDFTPDAIFRLAELQFERADEVYQEKLKDYRIAYNEFSEGRLPEEPEEPEQRFDRTIELYRWLVKDFPEYRFIDGAYYLLGYALQAQGEGQEGIKSWEVITERYPDSRFFDEVAFRVGDNYFQEEIWDKAIAAFLLVAPKKESRFYDKALYNLAWTYYLVNRFDEAVENFVELLDYSYAQKAKAGGGGGSVMEEEALQYIAISFQDDNWNRPGYNDMPTEEEEMDDEDIGTGLGYVRFAKEYMSKLGEKPYEREVFARLGDILFKGSKSKGAIEALRYAIDMEPMHKDAPKLQDLIISAYERERMFDDASRERDKLVALYSERTPWAEANRMNIKALREAGKLARASLYKAAIFYHQQAIKFVDGGDMERGVQSYTLAAQAYEAYLDRYPHDKDAYELTFYLAEAYYYSMNFDKAVVAYMKTRDSTQGTKYRGEAALNAIYAQEKIMERMVEAGELVIKDVFSTERPDVNAEPETIPKAQTIFIDSVDKFLLKAEEHEMAPAFSYKAASMKFAYGYFDDAVKRFERIIDLYQQHEAAKFAANLILDYLLAKQDWTKAAAYASRFKEQMVGGEMEEFAKIEGGAKFQIAKGILEKGDIALADGRITEGINLLEEGANRYLELLAEDPDREFADAMMYNAALSLEKARRPLRAADLYERLYKEYPKSTFAPESMFRVASKSEQAFNFEKAVRTYLALVGKYPESDKRADAQLNAALALEGQQKYKKAAKEFERYADMFPDKQEAPDVFFRSALIHAKRKDTRAQIKTLQEFIKRYKSKEEQIPKVVEAYVRIADIHLERYDKIKTAKKVKKRAKKLKAARKDVEAALNKAKEFHEQAPNSPAATYYAAKADFYLSEFIYAEYAKTGMTGTSAKKQGGQLKEKTEKLLEVQKVYENIISTYRQADWSLASLFRIGSLYDNLQNSIFDAPCPKDIARIDEIACEEYALMLEDRAYTIEDKAVEAYRTANDKAQELSLKNEWQQKTLEALNRLRPDDFPIDNTPLSRPTSGNVYAQDFIRMDGGAPYLREVMSVAETEEEDMEEEASEGAEGPGDGEEDGPGEEGLGDGNEETSETEAPTEEAGEEAEVAAEPETPVDSEPEPVDESAPGELEDPFDDEDEDK
ncbi:MAG: hypothetical protein CMH56_04575 [Myxococcales bacterium]|nr:hypothetical protein [Myxococcales bacterium]